MVYFVGAGTGAVDLITLRGKHLLEQADVIIYAGSLVNPALLAFAKEGSERHNSAELTLEEVLQLVRSAEEAGKMTVRLHTGDPSIYGAVREQMDGLERLGIPYESCPGVSACFGAAAALNLEYTLPGISQSLIITRMQGRTEVPPRESIESFAAHQASMAIYLSAARIEELSRRLMEGGYRPDTPAALVYKATWPEEEAYIGTVEAIGELAKTHGIHKTALVLVGEAIGQHPNYQKSRLYAEDFSTGFRKQKSRRGLADSAKGEANNTQTESMARSEANNSQTEEGTTQTEEGNTQTEEGITHVSIISFTENGRKLAREVAQKAGELEISLFVKRRTGQESREVYSRSEVIHKQGEASAPEHIQEYKEAFVQGHIQDWAGKQMEQRNALLFIGACGIAVRAIAPWLKSKLEDSPVLVMDEKGKHIIPILSGHMGGANALAACLAAKIGAEAIITTATDLNGTFAADLFAKKNHLSILNKEGIAKVSAKALAGKEIQISIEPGHWQAGGFLPKGVRIVPFPPAHPVEMIIASPKYLPETAQKILTEEGIPQNVSQEHKIPIGKGKPQNVSQEHRILTGEDGSPNFSQEHLPDLLLCPREYVIGIGCKKGTEPEKIDAFLSQALKEARISKRQVFAIASVIQKKKEPGILSWCQKEQIPFRVYTPKELQETEGQFRASPFVQKTIGVDNVCERSAIKACGQGGQLILHKIAADGMTLAVAKRKWRIIF